MSRDARGKVFGDGKADFDAFAGRHEAGWRFEVILANAQAQPDVVALLTIRTDGSVEFLSPDNEHAALGEGDRILTLSPPNAATIDVGKEPAPVYA